MKDGRMLRLTRHKRFVYNIISLIIFIFLFGMGLFSLHFERQLDETAFQREQIIEQQWREQARTTLQSLKIMLLHEIEEGEISPYNEQQIKGWAAIHLSNVRNGGPTGDSFLVDMSNEKILWNHSPDMNQQEKSPYLYLTDALQVFQDPSSGQLVFSEMRKLYSTNSQNNNTWNFDENPEFLEWVMIPTDGLGFKSEPFVEDGEKNPKYKGFLLALGTQKDEIMAPFAILDEQCKENKNYLFIFNICLFILGVSFIFWFIKRDLPSG